MEYQYGRMRRYTKSTGGSDMDVRLRQLLNLWSPILDGGGEGMGVDFVGKMKGFHDHDRDREEAMSVDGEKMEGRCLWIGTTGFIYIGGEGKRI